MDIQKRLGLAIVCLRRKAGISQEDFAKKANIDRCYMSSIENGKRQVSIMIIQKIADALEVPISKLFIEAENKRYFFTDRLKPLSFAKNKWEIIWKIEILLVSLRKHLNKKSNKTEKLII